VRSAAAPVLAVGIRSPRWRWARSTGRGR